MRGRSVALLLALFIALACVTASAQTVKRSAVTPTSPASGEEMFKAYCAPCHGIAGKELTQRNGGKFPELKVFGAIKGDVNTPAHGSKDMPIWGSVFQSLSHGDQGQIQLRISNLTKYIESLQAK
jgi:mono/diheme cytochrome c family protein